MDLRDLRYFEVIAEFEHLGLAARKVHRSPPALTKCIRRLEESLGTRLFERSGRGIRLSAAGRVLQRRARMMDVAMEDTQREVGAVIKGDTGHIRVGVAPTMAQYLLPNACNAFLGARADVTIGTLIGMSKVLRDALYAGQIDFAITIPIPDDDLVSHPIVEDFVVIVAGPGHEIFRRRRPTLKDLAHHRWVLPAASYDSEIRGFLDSVFRRHGMGPPKVQIETNSITSLPNLIAATGLLSLLSRRNLGRGHVAAPLQEVRIEGTTLRRHFALLYRKDSYLSPAALRLIELLEQQGQRLFVKGITQAK